MWYFNSECSRENVIFIYLRPSTAGNPTLIVEHSNSKDDDRYPSKEMLLILLHIVQHKIRQHLQGFTVHLKIIK